MREVGPMTQPTLAPVFASNLPAEYTDNVLSLIPSTKLSFGKGLPKY